MGVEPEFGEVAYLASEENKDITGGLGDVDLQH